MLVYSLSWLLKSGFLIEMSDLLYIINEKGDTEIKHYLSIYLYIYLSIILPRFHQNKFI